ncbi:MAG: nitroreductase family protein [Thermoplasmata archaeon]|nr:nitroreductase family protein [Euryarchaeota archaeon]RLF65424.1 MAG: nitroreductase family protein [Thermoplasmata archaeon]
MDAKRLLEIIISRRSIRKYKDAPVEEEKIRMLLEAARWAPSAGNLQPWYFLVVRDKRTREMLAEAAYGQTWMVEAPVHIVVFADPERSAYRYGERGRTLYCIQDTALAIQNMMLMAHALGLGTCFVGAFDERSVSKILCAPRHLRPIAIITVGYPAESPEPRPRRPLEEIVSEESFC